MAHGFSLLNFILTVFCVIQYIDCAQYCEARDFRDVVLYIRELRTSFQKFKNTIAGEIRALKDTFEREINEIRIAATTPTPRWIPNPPTTVQPTPTSTPRSTATPSSPPTTTTNRPTPPSTPRSTATPSSPPTTTTNRPTPTSTPRSTATPSSPPPTTTNRPNPTPIRLVNGLDMYSGTVEVYFQGQWGSICDDGFDKDDATVICRMLNYLDSYSYVRAYSSAQFGQSQGRITIDNLYCRGDEHDIADCPSNTWLEHNCGHSEDAGVNCRASTPDPTPIRLVNGPDMYSGTVEVYYQGQWGSICDDGFDNNDATVICRMLNYLDSNSNVQAYSDGHFGSSQGRITIDDLNCRGDEHDIADCPSNTWLSHNCQHSEDAGVNCRELF